MITQNSIVAVSLLDAGVFHSVYHSLMCSIACSVKLIFQVIMCLSCKYDKLGSKKSCLKEQAI